MSGTDDTLRIEGVEVAVHRPNSQGRGLRGWDAADELLIQYTHQNLDAGKSPRVLIVDDQFGALTLGLRNYAPVTVADSATLISALACEKTSAPDVTATTWLDPPDGVFHRVIMRIPRQADYLAWLLRWVNQRLVPDGQLIAGGMIKHLPDRSSEVFRALVTTQAALPARKKARVIVATPGKPTMAGWSEQWQGYTLPGTGYRVEGLPAVFSRRKLDIGTVELLPFVSRKARELGPRSRVLDLACGNGVLGLTALVGRPDLDIGFADVSSQALISARHNVELAFPEVAARYFHCDGVPEDAGKHQLILLNPPFHEGGVVGDHIALRLFEGVSRVLAPGGCLLMVGNRHLGYHRTLRQFFGRVTQLAASPKFVVFEAGQPRGRS